MRQVRTWHLFAAMIATVLVTLGVQAAIAGTTTTTRSGGAITRVRVVRGPNATETSSTTYVNLPGASTTITVPSGQRALILARFSAESQCTSSDESGYCTARIMIGGSEGAPAVGNDFAFDTLTTDSAGANAEDWWESHSMDRSRGSLGPGTYTVRVQYSVITANDTFRLDDWSLTVERVKV